MIITELPQTEVTILRLSGRFDSESRSDFKSAVWKAEAAGAKHIVINFQDVPEIDSTALGVLVFLQKDLRLRNARLSLACPQGYVRKVIDLLSLEKIIPVYEKEEAAVSSPALV